MLSKIIQFVKTHLDDIILVIGVILISLLSFAMGYITAKQEEKKPLKFERVNEAVASSSPFARLCLARVVNEAEASSSPFARLCLARVVNEAVASSSPFARLCLARVVNEAEASFPSVFLL